MGGDDGDETLDRFNARFYDAEPADYLRTRWQLLLLLGARSADLAKLFGEGLTFEGVTIGERGIDGETEVPDFDRHITTEVVTLHHHAAETLLRLYVAHAAAPTMPWIDVAERRNFGEFKKMIREEFVDIIRPPSEIGRVCLANGSKPPNVDDEWEDAISGIGAFLREMATTFLDDAPVYNALKHGLGGSPSNVTVLMGGQMMGRGPSIDYPEATPWVDDKRTWSLKTRWIRRQEALAMTDVAIRMIDSICRVGAATVAPPVGRPVVIDGLFYPVGLRPNDLRTHEGNGPMTTMTIPMVTVERTRF